MNSCGNVFRALFLTAIIILTFAFSKSSATDELSLRGIVKAVDSKAKIVTVDVKSESCLGLRHFKVDDPSKFTSILAKEVSFQIDKSTCKGKVKPKIMILEGRKI